MDPGILTTTLNNFLTVFSQGWVNLQPAINFLIKVFLGIEIVMFGFWMALGGIDNLVGIMKKLLYLLVWAWIIKKFPELSSAFAKSLVKAGQMAGGGVSSNIFDPSQVLKIGFVNLVPALNEVIAMGATLRLFESLVLGICLILVAIAYILIAWQIFYSVLEFYLISAIVGLFLPFGFFEPTKFLAEKSIGAIVSSGIKLMVLAFLVNIILPVLQTLKFSGDLTIPEVLSALLTVGALSFLCWNAPGVAAGLLSGSPNLSAAVAMQNAMAAGGMASHAIGGAIKAGGAAIGAVKAATSALTNWFGNSGGSGGGAGGKAGGAAGKMAGAAIQQSSRVAGQSIQKAGQGVSAAGQGMKSAGASIAATPVPVVSQAAGAAVGAAGTATDLAGKGMSAAGEGVEKAGEAAGKVADTTAEAGGKTVESAGNRASSGPENLPGKDNSSAWAVNALDTMQRNQQKDDSSEPEV
jgi:type IV secretion system protein TrbL